MTSSPGLQARHGVLQTTTDDRPRHTPATVTSLPPTLCVGGPDNHYQASLQWSL